MTEQAVARMPDPLTEEEADDLRQLRVTIAQERDAQLEPDQWKRLVALQNKEYRYKESIAEGLAATPENKRLKMQRELGRIRQADEGEGNTPFGTRRRPQDEDVAPTNIRQMESLTNATNHLFTYLFKVYEKKGVSQLQNVFNIFREEHDGRLSEKDVLGFVSRVEYFVAFEAQPLRTTDQHHNADRGMIKSFQSGHVNELVKDSKQESFESFQNHPTQEAHYQRSNYQATRPYQSLNMAPQGPGMIQRSPYKTQFRPQILQRPHGSQPSTKGLRSVRKLPSTNPNDYPSTVTCRLCKGNSRNSHCPPFYRICSIFPNEFPTKIHCPHCNGEHRIAKDGICRNPLLSQLKAQPTTEAHSEELDLTSEQGYGYEPTFTYQTYD